MLYVRCACNLFFTSKLDFVCSKSNLLSCRGFFVAVVVVRCSYIFVLSSSLNESSGRDVKLLFGREGVLAVACHTSMSRTRKCVCVCAGGVRTMCCLLVTMDTVPNRRVISILMCGIFAFFSLYYPYLNMLFGSLLCTIMNVRRNLPSVCAQIHTTHVPKIKLIAGL